MRANANGRLVFGQARVQLKERLQPTPRQTQSVNHILPDRTNKQIACKPGALAPRVCSHPGPLPCEFAGNHRVQRNSIGPPPGATGTVDTTGEDSIVLLDRQRRGRAA